MDKMPIVRLGCDLGNTLYEHIPPGIDRGAAKIIWFPDQWLIMAHSSAKKGESLQVWKTVCLFLLSTLTTEKQWALASAGRFRVCLVGILRPDSLPEI
jgi:hypothetical protein